MPETTTEPPVVALLVAARAKIDTPDKWCKGVLAMDVHGCPVGEKSSKARRWCALGCVQSVAGDDNLDDIAVGFLYRNVGHISTFNDDEETTHADVLAMFDLAIALARKEHT